MALIIKQPFRMFDALNYIDKFQQHVINGATIDPENYLYVGIAKQTDWGTNGSGGEELNPELPVDSITQEVRYWTDLVALQRIQPHQLIPVIERKNWNNNTQFEPYNNDNALHEQGNYYCINDSFQVFRCTAKHATELPDVAPHWVTGDPKSYVGSDGYGWEYIYQISPAEVQNVLQAQSAWIPVPIEYAAGDVGNGKSIPLRYLHCRHVMVRLDITEASMPIVNSDNTPITYRQVGLLLNPVSSADTSIKLSATSVMPEDLTKITTTNIEDLESRLIYLENRTVVSRQAGQTESVQIVIKF